jgi:tetratricopeptide (TPR) repeat protein
MTPLRAVGLVIAVFVVTLPVTFVMNHGLPAHFALLNADDNDLGPDDPVVDALCLKAVAALSNEQYDKAIAAYTEAIKRDPKYPYAYIGRGDAYLLKGDLDRAQLDYDQALRLDPQNEEAKARGDLVREERANR